MAELIFLTVLVGVMFVVARRLGFGVSDQTILVLARGIFGWTHDSWPRGVQEEDRDRPWGRAPGTPPSSGSSTAPPVLSRVKPITHAR